MSDISFNNNPQGGKYLGWVYTTDNAWKRFGSISTATNFDNHTFDAVTSPIFNPTGIVTAVFSGSLSVGGENHTAGAGASVVVLEHSIHEVQLTLVVQVKQQIDLDYARVTTTERGNLSGIQTGAIIYNLTTSKFPRIRFWSMG